MSYYKRAISTYISIFDHELGINHHSYTTYSFKTGQGTNLADIMENVGLGEIMQPTANYGKISEKPVQVDAINHKVSNSSSLLNSSYTT